MSAWIQLPHLTAVTLRGPDAHAFAHAQFTTSFQNPSEGGWSLTAWCNPKGRVISTILARSDENGVDLIFPVEQADLLIRKLPMYAIGRKVEIRPQARVAGRFEPHLPAGFSLDIDPRRALCLAPDDARTDHDQCLRWRKRDLCSGIAWMTGSSSGQFLPQALGLEERDGLSYQKGCYPGQEVIARVHYLGRSKERLGALRLDESVDCADQPLLLENRDRIGTVLQAICSDHQTIGLAVVRSEYPTGQTVICGEVAGTLCEPEQLC